MVDIQGLDKTALLFALWTNSQPASFFMFSGRAPPPFNEEQAKKAVTQYIDYFCGRVIKSDLTGDKVDPRGYDRDNGQGAFQSVVDRLRN